MTNVLTAVLAVFDEVGTWFVDAINNLVPMYYDPQTGLTFIGVLSVASLAIAVTLLLVRTIGDFIAFRRG